MPGELMAPFELAERLALGLALAVFFGLAFEEVYKREDRSVPGGIRTFPLLALAGSLLYLVEPHHAVAFVVGLVALAAWLYAFLWLEAPPDGRTLVIPAANLLAYALGPIALTQPRFVAVAAAVVAVLLIGWRERLHGFVRDIPQDEILTAGKFLVLAGIILPLLPDERLIQMAPVTPYRAWFAVVAISGLSYATYLIQRYYPVRGGVLLPALLGGAYSSTVTTVVLAKRQREAGVARPEISAGIVAATAMMYPRLGIVIAVFGPSLALLLLPALGVLLLAAAGLAWMEWRRSARGDPAELSIPTVNPLQLTTALVFAALFLAISLATAWVERAFGQTGVFALAALVGASDIDPFVLTLAQGTAVGLGMPATAAAVLIAASANNLAKAGYALGFGGGAAAMRPAALLSLLALLGFAAAALYLTLAG
jgi:uncharacterized membrane protein (DUF4010 family)